MITTVPAEIRISIEETLNLKIQDFLFSSGGCINNGGCLITSSGKFFFKWNKGAPLPEMFEREAEGLQLLKSTSTVTVPEVIHHGRTAEYQFLMIEYFNQLPKTKRYWSDFASQLAALHGCSSPSYGLQSDNYIGSLPQSNRQHMDWFSFFISESLCLKLNWPEKKICYQ